MEPGHSRQNATGSTHCPLSGVQVLEYASKKFTIAEWQVTWWNCPSCGGWHLLTTKNNQEKESLPVDPSYQPTPL